MESYNTQLWTFLDILLASCLSALVGFERETHNKPAGLRTNMIVGSVACFFVSVGSSLLLYFNMGTEAIRITSDPLRIIEAIVVGVSFIGAGTIIKSNNNNSVQNLTTAATLLYSASIGISIALHHYILAVGLSLLILIINKVIHVIESKWINGNNDQNNS